jgi:hexosaminidase
MRKTLTFTFLLFSILSVAQDAKKTIAIIPEPVSVKQGTGSFRLPAQLRVEAPANPELKQVLAVLKQHFSAVAGSTYSVSNVSPGADIRLVLNPTENPAIGKEGYQLSVTQKNILIKANQPAGLFYGVQSLLQLFPKEIESKERVTGVKWEAPVVEITDNPRFGWRGLMFDVARK